MRTISQIHLTMNASGTILNTNNWRLDDSRDLRRKIRYTGNLDQVPMWPLNRKIANLFNTEHCRKLGMTIFVWPFSLALLGSAFGDAVYGAQLKAASFFVSCHKRQ